MVTERIRVDPKELTLAEHAEAAEIAADAGHTGDGPGTQFYSVAAMAYLVHRRVDPTFTYADALNLKMGDLELVNDEDEPPEVPGVSNGAAPQPLPVSGP